MISLIFSCYKIGLSKSTLSTNFFYSSSNCFYCLRPVLHESNIVTVGSSLSTNLPAMISVGECLVGLMSSSIFLHSFCRVTESSIIFKIRCLFSSRLVSRDLYLSLIDARCSSRSMRAYSSGSSNFSRFDLPFAN